MREGGATLMQSRQAVDRMSAILILESYLGFLENRKTVGDRFPMRGNSIG